MSRTHLLRPRVILPHIHDITPDFMEAHGLKGLLLDLDNTLIPYGSYEERTDVTAWARDLQTAGYALYLLSNATRERARIWAQRLGLPGVGLAGKPFAREYRRGLSAVGLPAHQVAMVGDQLFTDVLGGNWSGMFTVMVRPISDNALPHTRLTRRLERLVLKRYGHDWAPRKARTGTDTPLTPPPEGPDATINPDSRHGRND
ncbi:YqeG family HAD IIIA-type phosphatase [Deinococcus aquiradiocola]|uniref:Haloacid dehalogenase n=1 Tax=Deinococcus aquiradiocola TaxID=393059 RepID=A0A917PSE1_9DEIO|nr:YqeG family HAD IIIA-type phosphatase [Deinococcus aquiradiocola]GGJ89345.1 haloacid dehalogenase [Deinococcus aquiradiocola]